MLPSPWINQNFQHFYEGNFSQLSLLGHYQPNMVDYVRFNQQRANYEPNIQERYGRILNQENYRNSNEDFNTHREPLFPSPGQERYFGRNEEYERMNTLRENYNCFNYNGDDRFMARNFQEEFPRKRWKNSPKKKTSGENRSKIEQNTVKVARSSRSSTTESSKIVQKSEIIPDVTESSKTGNVKELRDIEDKPAVVTDSGKNYDFEPKNVSNETLVKTEVPESDISSNFIRPNLPISEIYSDSESIASGDEFRVRNLKSGAFYSSRLPNTEVVKTEDTDDGTKMDQEFSANSSERSKSSGQNCSFSPTSEKAISSETSESESNRSLRSFSSHSSSEKKSEFVVRPTYEVEKCDITKKMVTLRYPCPKNKCNRHYIRYFVLNTPMLTPHKTSDYLSLPGLRYKALLNSLNNDTRYFNVIPKLELETISGGKYKNKLNLFKQLKRLG